MQTEPIIDRLFESLSVSTCNFLAVERIASLLRQAGFQELCREDSWEVAPGGKYFMTINGSALFAFIEGRNPTEHGVKIISAHSDSPGFKIKTSPEIVGDGGVVKLNVEKYGGPIMYTWFDRPLSVSGRVMLQSDDPFSPEERLVDFRRPIATIPHLAIHFNRAVNEGNRLSVQKDMLPVVGYFSKEELDEFRKEGGFVRHALARELNVESERILDYELTLYPLSKPLRVGYNGEYFQSARIDDLSMAFAAIEALIDASERLKGAAPAATLMAAIFDNEETGSGTKQGAASPVLRDLIDRLGRKNGRSDEDLYRTIANSFMISADDAHGWHPNYNEKYDPTNHPVLGGGPVVKINANCKYMTDARGGAVFRALCKAAGVNCQSFVNHSDVAGGSTLGNISSSQLDINGVDVGAAIWAMHSAAETAAVSDHIDMVKVFCQFFRSYH